MKLEDKFDTLYKKEKWKSCEKILNKILKKEPESFWAWTSLSSVVYEQRRYSEAECYSEKAYEINKESPLVWWDYASVLYMLDKEKKAIKFWKKIIALDAEELGCIRTSQGKDWAMSIINDSHYRLGKAYFYQGKYLKSKKYLNIYIAQLEQGVSSLYKKKKVKKLLRELEKNLNKL